MTQILEDTEVVSKFFQTAVKKRETESENIEPEQDTTSVDFLQWYYSDSTSSKRVEVENRIQRLLTPADSKFKVAQKAVCLVLVEYLTCKKNMQRYAKKLKTRKEKQTKQSAILSKVIQENEEKRKQKLVKSVQLYQAVNHVLDTQRKQHFTIGEEFWKQHFMPSSTT